MRYRFASRSVSSQAFGVLALFPFETFLAIQKVPDRRPDERVRWTPPKLAQSLQPSLMLCVIIVLHLSIEVYRNGSPSRK
jgi:hypothetical protein